MSPRRHHHAHADCRHEIKPITSGHRLCLIYNLIQKEGTPALQAPYDYHMSNVQQLMKLVRQWQGDKEGPEKLILQLQPKYALLCSYYFMPSAPLSTVDRR